jgi:hypothetical protein
MSVFVAAFRIYEREVRAMSVMPPPSAATKPGVS